MTGYRKFTVALVAMGLSQWAVLAGVIEGLQYASIITLVVAAYVGGNVAAKSATPTESKS